MTTAQRASVAGRARMMRLTADEKSEQGRKGAQGAHSLRTLANRIAKAWHLATDEEREEARRVLRNAGIMSQPAREQ